jgi:hypothetical protein
VLLAAVPECVFPDLRWVESELLSWERVHASAIALSPSLWEKICRWQDTYALSILTSPPIMWEPDAPMLLAHAAGERLLPIVQYVLTLALTVAQREHKTDEATASFVAKVLFHRAHMDPPCPPASMASAFGILSEAAKALIGDSQEVCVPIRIDRPTLILTTNFTAMQSVRHWRPAFRKVMGRLQALDHSDLRGRRELLSGLCSYPRLREEAVRWMADQLVAEPSEVRSPAHD